MTEREKERKRVEELWGIIVKMYGTRCEAHRNQILKRLDALIACTVYKAYGKGHPLYDLDMAFRAVPRYLKTYK